MTADTPTPLVALFARALFEQENDGTPRLPSCALRAADLLRRAGISEPAGLVWQEHDEDHLCVAEAKTPFTTWYNVDQHHDGYHATHDHEVIGAYPDEPAARAACEADYAARLLAAGYVPAGYVPAGEAERWRRRAYDLAVAIMGGEDAPGFADSVDTATLVAQVRANYRMYEQGEDLAIRERDAAREALRRIVREIEQMAAVHDMDVMETVLDTARDALATPPAPVVASPLATTAVDGSGGPSGSDNADLCMLRGPLADVMAMSAVAGNDRVLQLHFTRPVTSGDREALLAWHNATRNAVSAEAVRAEIAQLKAEAHELRIIAAEQDTRDSEAGRLLRAKARSLEGAAARLTALLPSAQEERADG